jgi:hypothetical protein
MSNTNKSNTAPRPSSSPIHIATTTIVATTSTTPHPVDPDDNNHPILENNNTSNNPTKQRSSDLEQGYIDADLEGDATSVKTWNDDAVDLIRHTTPLHNNNKLNDQHLLTTTTTPPHTPFAPNHNNPNNNNNNPSLQQHQQQPSFSPPSYVQKCKQSISTQYFNLRKLLGDICDTTIWEIIFVLLTLVFFAITIIEVSLLYPQISPYTSLLGLSMTSAIILGLFLIETIIKTIAYGNAFWIVPRNVVDSILIISTCSIQIAIVILLYNTIIINGATTTSITDESTSATYVTSRVLRLLVCVSRQKRIRELWTALRAESLRGQKNLTTLERTLGILQDIKSKYPLSDVDILQLSFCIDAITTRKLYTEFFVVSNVDQETAEWLYGTYSTGTKPTAATATTTGATNNILPRMSVDGSNAMPEQEIMGSASSLLPAGTLIGGGGGSSSQMIINNIITPNIGNNTTTTMTNVVAIGNNNNSGGSITTGEKRHSHSRLSAGGSGGSIPPNIHNITTQQQQQQQQGSSSTTGGDVLLSGRKHTPLLLSSSNNSLLQQQQQQQQHQHQHLVHGETGSQHSLVGGSNSGLTNNTPGFGPSSSATGGTILPTTTTTTNPANDSNEPTTTTAAPPPTLKSRITRQLSNAMLQARGPTTSNVDLELLPPPASLERIVASGMIGLTEQDVKELNRCWNREHLSATGGGSGLGRGGRSTSFASSSIDMGIALGSTSSAAPSPIQTNMRSAIPLIITTTTTQPQQPPPPASTTTTTTTIQPYSGLITSNKISTLNSTLDDWNFNIFSVVVDPTDGFPLAPVLISSLHRNGIFDDAGLHYHLSLDPFYAFAVELERGYIVENAYHNRIHAGDVVQVCHHFLTHRRLRDTLTPLDRMALLISAACHDFKHPGVNNAFLCATSHRLAVLYNDSSVLENMHVSEAFELMRSRPDCNILASLPTLVRNELRDTIIQMILATDMKVHTAVMNDFKTQVVSTGQPAKTLDNLGAQASLVIPMDPDSSFRTTSSAAGLVTNGLAPTFPLDYRRTILKTTLHAADVSNPARPSYLCKKWALLVQEEFFRQGDLERDAGIPSLFFMDRNKPMFAKVQDGFSANIVLPLFETFWGLVPSHADVARGILADNIAFWKRMLNENDPMEFVRVAVVMEGAQLESSGNQNNFQTTTTTSSSIFQGESGDHSNSIAARLMTSTGVRSSSGGMPPPGSPPLPPPSSGKKNTWMKGSSFTLNTTTGTSSSPLSLGGPVVGGGSSSSNNNNTVGTNPETKTTSSGIAGYLKRSFSERNRGSFDATTSTPNNIVPTTTTTTKTTTSTGSVQGGKMT